MPNYTNYTDADGVVWRAGWVWNARARFYQQKTMTKVSDPSVVHLSEPWDYPLLRLLDWLLDGELNVPQPPWATGRPASRDRAETVAGT